MPQTTTVAQLLKTLPEDRRKTIAGIRKAIRATDSRSCSGSNPTAQRVWLPVLEGVDTKSRGAASFGLSLDGSLVYLSNAAGPANVRTLVWVDRQGRTEALGTEPRPVRRPPALARRLTRGPRDERERHLGRGAV